MQIKKAKISTVGDIYFLINDSGKLVMEVYRFMLFLRLNNKSINTNRAYCNHLKLYYDWLSLTGMTYKSAIESKNKVLTNLSNFKFWLKYPDFNEKLIPISGFKQKRSTESINQIMSVVLCFYDFLVQDQGLPELNVYRETRANSLFHGFLDELSLKKEKTLTNIFRERTPKKALKYISRTQFKALYKACNNQRDRIIIGLLFEGGLRVSEVIGLNIEDVKDIRNNKINIKLREDENNPDAFVKYCSEGTVFIPDYLRDEIIDYLLNTLINVKTDYLIVNLYSKVNRYKPMKRRTIEEMVEKLGKKIGIPDLHPHMLRHSIAVDMLEKGCDMVQIKDKLRHRSINTTSNIYAEVNDKARKDAMELYSKKVDEDFSPDVFSMAELADFLLEEKEDEND